MAETEGGEVVLEGEEDEWREVESGKDGGRGREAARGWGLRPV